MQGMLRDHNPFNLDFIEEEEKVEWYRDQILDMAKMTDQQMLNEFFNNQGLCHLKGNQDYSQKAVLQALLEVFCLKKHFIYRRQQLIFSNMADMADPFLKKMSDLYCTVFSPNISELDDLKEMEVGDCFKDLYSGSDPAEFFTRLLREIVRVMSPASTPEFKQRIQEACVRKYAETGDSSYLRMHFDEAFPSLAA